MASQNISYSHVSLLGQKIIDIPKTSVAVLFGLSASARCRGYIQANIRLGKSKVLRKFHLAKALLFEKTFLKK